MKLPITEPRKKRILFFDSGMGGFSIMQSVEATFGESLEYFYYFDNDLFPYSTKPQEILIEKLVRLLQFTCNKYQIDIVVIACNTASTIILDPLRQALEDKIPVVGVVPAIKLAAQYHLDNNLTHKNIGLLATEATVKRAYTHQLVADFATPHNINVDLYGTTELVEYAEALFKKDSPYSGPSLDRILSKWVDNQNANLGTIVLACTHFSLVKEQIQNLFPEVKLLDSCFAITKRIAFLLDCLDNPDAMQHNQELENYNRNLQGFPLKAQNKHLLSTAKLDQNVIKHFQTNLGFQDYTLAPHIL